MMQAVAETIKKTNFLSFVNKFFNKRGRTKRLLISFVYIPTFILGFYLTFIYSNMYVSETNFALRSNDGNEMPAVATMLFQTSSSTTLDAYVIQSYISSGDMLDKIRQHIDYQGHYGDRSKDIYSRLTSNPTKEQLLEHWRWVTTAAFNTDKGIISVEVKAYTPEMAKAVNDAVLEYSEELVNQMNLRAHEDALRLTRLEIASAEGRLLRAQLALQKFRNDKSVLDPKATAAGLEGVVAGLEAESANAQAELIATLQVMQQNSPRVLKIKARIDALKEQIDHEKARLAGLTQNGSLSSLVGDYAQLATEEKFAQDMLVKAMSAYEAARIKSISQSRYIVPFEKPSLPQESDYPKPLLFTIFGFLFFLVTLGIVSLIIAAIKDHTESGPG